jgi:hypothetical protein
MKWSGVVRFFTKGAPYIDSDDFFDRLEKDGEVFCDDSRRKEVARLPVQIKEGKVNLTRNERLILQEAVRIKRRIQEGFSLGLNESFVSSVEPKWSEGDLVQLNDYDVEYYGEEFRGQPLEISKVTEVYDDNGNVVDVLYEFEDEGLSLFEDELKPWS